MIIAVIDLGTNTFNLLIVEFVRGTYNTLYRTKIPVKLGEGSINRYYIAPVPFQRGIDALKEYRTILNKYRVDKVVAFATSAIRSASNRKEFVMQAKEEADIDIHVISGDEEAQLIYYGVRKAVDIGPQAALIMDIGGGSTELIIANHEKIFWKRSFDLGAARLLERIAPSDPITPDEVQRLEDYLSVTLIELFFAVERYPVEELIGSSGSFDTFAEMILHKFHNPEVLADRTEYHFNIDEFNIIHEQLLRSTKEERLKTKGLIEMRADMIVVSSILVHFLLKKLNLKKMRLSTYSLKEGVLWGVIKV